MTSNVTILCVTKISTGYIHFARPYYNQVFDIGILNSISTLYIMFWDRATIKNAFVIVGSLVNQLASSLQFPDPTLKQGR